MLHGATLWHRLAAVSDRKVISPVGPKVSLSDLHPPDVMD